MSGYVMSESANDLSKVHDYIMELVPPAATRQIVLTAAALRQFLVQERDVKLAAPRNLAKLKAAVFDCNATMREQPRHLGGRHRGAESEIKREVVGQIMSWLAAEDELNSSPDHHSGVKQAVGTEIERSGMHIVPQANIAILTAEPGLGKSVVLSQVLKLLEVEGVPVIAIKADLQLQDLKTCGAIHLCAQVHLPEHVHVAARALAEEMDGKGPVVVIVDQLDALSLSMSHDNTGINAIANLIYLLQNQRGVRCLFSCRTFDLKSDPVLSRVGFCKTFDVEPFSYDEVAQFLSKEGIDFRNLDKVTQSILCKPLNLNIFIQHVDSQKNLNTDINHYLQIGKINSLQSLYNILWERVMPEYNYYVRNQKLNVIYGMVDAMEKAGQTVALVSAMSGASSPAFQEGIDALERDGLIIKTRAGLTFLHQTFFDYACSRKFVEANFSIYERLQNDHQGLSERPLLINVLSYLRATDRQKYVTELDELGVGTYFKNPEVREHLNQLMREWFGALPEPSDNEWQFAERLLRQPDTASSFLYHARGNYGWFERLIPRYIPSWLHTLNSNSEGDAEMAPSFRAIFLFLSSFVNDSVGQPKLGAMLAPLVDSTGPIQTLISNWVFLIHEWHSAPLVELYGKILIREWHKNSLLCTKLRYIASQRPAEGCRVLKQILDRLFDNVLGEEAPPPPSDPWQDIFAAEMESSSSGARIHGETLRLLAELEPTAFLEATIPFFEEVVKRRLDPASLHALGSYPNDDFNQHNLHGPSWEIERLHHFGVLLPAGVMRALRALAEVNKLLAEPWLRRLQAVEGITAQLLVTEFFIESQAAWSEQAYEYLVADERRLELGNDAWITRRLLKAGSAYWSPQQLANLQDRILQHVVYPPNFMLGDQNYCGREQWRLLVLFQPEQFSDAATARLKKLRVRFEAQQSVEAPLPPKELASYLDEDWLHAFRSEGANGNNASTAAGGDEGLALELERQVLQQPERFLNLFQNSVPLAVDALYVTALIRGAVKSDVDSQAIFDVCYRFSGSTGFDRYGDLRTTIVSAIAERASDGVPDLLIVQLVSWLRPDCVGTEDEARHCRPDGNYQATEENAFNERASLDGSLMDFLNTTRGRVLDALFKAYQGNLDNESQWVLINSMANQPADALRTGAVAHLCEISGLNTLEHSVMAFTSLVTGHRHVLRTEYSLGMLRWLVGHRVVKALPLLEELLSDKDAMSALVGADLMFQFAVRQDEPDVALVNHLINGPISWRSGIARAAARLVTWPLGNASKEQCERVLFANFDDVEEFVLRTSSELVGYLTPQNLFELAPLVEKFIHSKAFPFGSSRITQLLHEHGTLHPDWTLRQLAFITSQRLGSSEGSSRLESRTLFPAILQLYHLSIVQKDPVFRENCMNVFDSLFAHFPGEANEVLNRYDEGRFQKLAS